MIAIIMKSFNFLILATSTVNNP